MFYVLEYKNEQLRVKHAIELKRLFRLTIKKVPHKRSRQTIERRQGDAGCLPFL